MDLTQLNTLIRVAELGSLSKAADALQIAQPALSRQVRLLEEELGVPLFTRHGRGMVLTEQGHDVLKHAKRILGEIEEIRASASDTDRPLTGQIAIGLPPTVAEIISVPLVAAFRKTHPGAVLRLVSAYTGYLLDWLHRGEIDLAVLYDPQSARSLKSEPLLLENLFLIGPKEARFSPVRAKPFRALAGQRLLLPSIRHGLRKILERCALQAGITLDVVVEADTFSTLKDLVASGHGWTVLPLASIHPDLNAKRLTAAPLIEPAPVRRLVLSYPSDRPATRLARFAGDAIKSIVSEQVERGIWAGQLLEGQASNL